MSSSIDISIKKQSVASTVEIYSDINSNPVKGGSNRVVNFNAIQQSLDNLFNTRKYSRPFRPNYYSPVDDLIGELATEDNAIALNSLMYNRITINEPRIIYDTSQSFASVDKDNNSYYINIVFSIVGDIDIQYIYKTRIQHILT